MFNRDSLVRISAVPFLFLILYSIIKGSDKPNSDILSREAGGQIVSTIPGAGGYTTMDTSSPVLPPAPMDIKPHIPEPQANKRANVGGGILGFIMNLGRKSDKEIRMDKVREGIEKAMSKTKAGIPWDSEDYKAMGTADLTKAHTYPVPAPAFAQELLQATPAMVQAPTPDNPAHVTITMSMTVPEVPSVPVTDISIDVPTTSDFKIALKTPEQLIANFKGPYAPMIKLDPTKIGMPPMPPAGMVKPLPTAIVPSVQIPTHYPPSPSTWQEFSNFTYKAYEWTKDKAEQNPIIATGVVVVIAGGVAWFGGKALYRAFNPEQVKQAVEVAKEGARDIPKLATTNAIGEDISEGIKEAIKGKQPMRPKASDEAHPNPTPDPRTLGVEPYFTDHNCSHFYNDKTGKFANKTPENMEMIVRTIKEGKYHGQDAKGNHRYSHLDKYGNQVYAHIRDNGLIQEAGINVKGSHYVLDKKGKFLVPGPNELARKNGDGFKKYAIPMTGGGLMSYQDTYSAIDEWGMPMPPYDRMPNDELPDFDDLPPAPEAITVKDIKLEEDRMMHIAAKGKATMDKMVNIIRNGKDL